MKLIGTYEQDGSRVEAEAETYETARDMLDAAVPEGKQLLSIRVER